MRQDLDDDILIHILITGISKGPNSQAEDDETCFETVVS